MANRAPYKLAIRHEGIWWVAYFDTLQASGHGIELSRISMRIVADHPDIKAKFIEVNQMALQAMLADVGLPIEGWLEPTIAPESERSGHG